MEFIVSLRLIWVLIKEVTLLKNYFCFVYFKVFARTPPDGHRPPVPGQQQDTPTKSIVKNADTQTINSWMDVLGSLSPNNNIMNNSRDKRSSSISSISPGFAISPAPDGNTTSPDQHQNTTPDITTATTSPTKLYTPGGLHSGTAVGENQSDEQQTATHVPKFASSPKPNNSFMFARGPPDGAEKVSLNIEEIR